MFGDFLVFYNKSLIFILSDLPVKKNQSKLHPQTNKPAFLTWPISECSNTIFDSPLALLSPHTYIENMHLKDESKFTDILCYVMPFNEDWRIINIASVGSATGQIMSQS